MSGSRLVEQIVMLLDQALDRGEPSLPRWARLRIVRMLRELDTDEQRRAAVVEVTSVRRTALFSPDLGRALEASLEPPPVRTTTQHSAAGGRDFKGRRLSDVPRGIRVTYQGVSATIRPPGIVLDDGQEFETPTPAAEYVNGGTPVNGWQVWVVTDGRSLGECFDARNWPRNR